MIEFQHVFKSYGRGRNILADINFRIEPGEFIFVSGPSGAGKSTLLKLIGGLEPASRGSISVNGRRIDQMPPRARPYLRRAVGVILQDTHLLYDRNAMQNVMLPLTVIGLEKSLAITRSRAALEKVGLLAYERQRPDTLSTGEQQRVGIARAIVARPSLLIADEPTGNLDPQLAVEIMGLFAEFQQVGTTVLVASHDLPLIKRMKKRVIVLDHGRLVADVSAQEIL